MEKNLIYEHLKVVQSQIDKYDDLSSKTKTWAVTVWVGLLGWSFKTEQKELILLSFVVVVIFWLLDTIYKNFRQDYRILRTKLTDALNNEVEIGFDFPKHKPINTFKQLFRPHLFLVYFSLLLLSILAYF